jgi:drug/metabolite transporter (DMT)-like permease
MHGRIPTTTGLVLGVGGTAWAAIFVRLADEAPALTIAGYRMAIAAGILGAVALGFGLLRRATLPRRADLGLLALSGLFLAAHFWSWFASLERTSVGSSVVIVGMQPLLAAFLGFAVLRERPVRAEWLGIAVATAGVLIIGGRDFVTGGEHLVGDLLALLGGIFGAAYRTIGRMVRADISTTMYSGVVYTIAALALWTSIAGVQPETAGFETETWLYLVLVALVPQVIGHTAFNWALGHYRVVTIGIVSLGEPILATLIAIPVLNENPSLGVILGGPLVLAGVVVGLRGAASGPALAVSRRPRGPTVPG